MIRIATHSARLSIAKEVMSANRKNLFTKNQKCVEAYPLDVDIFPNFEEKFQKENLEG